MQSKGFRIFLPALLLVLFFNGNLFSQNTPLQWGEIPKTDLEMKTYPADTNASAVILCDYGESHIDNSLHIVFERTKRIKILNKNGYDNASFAIKLYTKNGRETIRDIEGATYWLNEKGEVEDKELDDDQIYEEKADDNNTIYKFTLPGLVPGCVIEYRYTIEFDNFWEMPDWTFQSDEPVEWSEYNVCFPENIVYQTVMQGYDQFFMNEKTIVYKMFQDNAAYYLGSDNVRCYQWRWIIKNAPAIRDVPFITTPKDYKDRVSLQLAGYSLLGTGVKKFLNDWQTLCNDLVKSEDFGQQLDKTGDVEDIMKKITTGLTDPMDKVKAIYNWVKKTMVWNGRCYFTSDIDAEDLIESKKGDDADINFLLITLLRSAGINVDPVILSTRSNGKIQALYPILDQFNYVIAKVNLGTNSFYLDATDPLRPYDLLPEAILGVKGLVVQKDNPQWVNISSDKSDYRVTGAEILVQDDGSLKCEINNQVKDYGALDLRQDIAGLKDYKEYAKNYFNTESRALTLDSVKISGIDSINQSPIIKAWLSSQDYAQQNGDMIYINPQIIRVLKSNPLKTKERKFPLDFNNKLSRTVIVNMIFPVNYEVKDLLLNKFYKFGTKGTMFTRQSTVNNNTLQIITKFNLNETYLDPESYDELKIFFAKIIECEAEQIVLTKKKVPEVQESAAPAPEPAAPQKQVKHIESRKHAKK